MLDSIRMEWRRVAFAAAAVVVMVGAGCAAYTPKDDSPEEATRVEANKAETVNTVAAAASLIPGAGPFVELLLPLGLMLATGKKQ